jgi:YidC/Oxa1 family membrane protein insertase
MKRGMMPATTPDNPMGQSQKYMMYIMPVFALSGLYWPFGLVLYWVTTNVWTLGQQWILFRNYPKPAEAGAAGAAAPAIAPTVTAKPKRPLLPGSRQARGAGNQDAAKSDGASQANGAARGNANGSPPRSARKAAGSPAGSSAGQGAQPSANGGGAGGMLRRLGKGRAEPEPPPPEPEVKLVRQQKQRQSRSKRSGKR